MTQPNWSELSAIVARRTPGELVASGPAGVLLFNGNDRTQMFCATIWERDSQAIVAAVNHFAGACAEIERLGLEVETLRRKQPWITESDE